MTSPVDFTSSIKLGFLVGRLEGELDMANAAALRGDMSAALPNTARGVVLDLSALSYIDSAGVRVLFSLAELLRARRQQLRLVVPAQAPILTVLKHVDLARTAPIHEDLDAALVAADTASTSSP